MKLLHVLHLEGDNSRARWSGHLGLDLHVELRAPVGAIHRKEKNHGIEESDEEAQEGQETAGDETAPFAEFLEDRDEILDPKSGLTRRDSGAGTPTNEKNPLRYWRAKPSISFIAMIASQRCACSTEFSIADLSSWLSTKSIVALIGAQSAGGIDFVCACTTSSQL